MRVGMLARRWREEAYVDAWQAAQRWKGQLIASLYARVEQQLSSVVYYWDEGQR